MIRGKAPFYRGGLGKKALEGKKKKGKKIITGKAAFSNWTISGPEHGWLGERLMGGGGGEEGSKDLTRTGNQIKG